VVTAILPNGPPHPYAHRADRRADHRGQPACGTWVLANERRQAGRPFATNAKAVTSLATAQVVVDEQADGAAGQERRPSSASASSRETTGSTRGITKELSAGGGVPRQTRQAHAARE